MGKFLPECLPAWVPITLAQLMDHSSAIPNFLELPEMETYHFAPHTPDETIALVKDKPLEFQPGTRKHYSSTGYVPSVHHIPHLASLFEKRPGSERVYPAAPWSQTIHFSGGGMYSTVGDLFRWERALFGGQVLSPHAFTQVTTGYCNAYGFGLGIGQLDVHVVYRHIGVVEGFAATMAYVPDTGTTVIVLSNLRSPDAESLGENLLLASHGGEVKPPF